MGTEETKNPTPHSRKKQTNKRMRYLKYKSHLERVWKITQYHYIHPPVMYVDYIYIKGKRYDRKVPFYRREAENHGGKGRRFYKRQSNRRVRYYKGGIAAGGNYRKLFDYRWMID